MEAAEAAETARAAVEQHHRPPATIEAAEAVETIREVMEEEQAAERAAHAREERFRKRAGLVIAVLAALLAVTALGNEHTNRDADRYTRAGRQPGCGQDRQRRQRAE